MGATRRDWLERYARALGLEAPTDAEVDALLALAGTAAHASERTAAPLSAWLVGRAGIEPEEARLLAQQVASALEGQSDPD